MIKGDRFSKFRYARRLKEWSQQHFLPLVIMNLVLMLVVLLRTAGYFAPYLILTINLIVMLSLIMGVIFLGLRSRGMVMVAIVLWLLSALLRLLGVEIWADRSSIYVYQALIVTLVLLLIESRTIKKD